MKQNNGGNSTPIHYQVFFTLRVFTSLNWWGATPQQRP